MLLKHLKRIKITTYVIVSISHPPMRDVCNQPLNITSNFLSVAPRSASAPGCLSEMYVSGPHLRPAKSDTLGWSSAICAVTSPAGDSDPSSDLRIVVGDS